LQEEAKFEPVRLFGAQILSFPGAINESMQHNSQHKANYIDIPTQLIVPSAFNPRKHFDSEYIRELAESMKRDGQWDPLLVRRGKKNKYELIAGECRLRAAKLLGLKSLKARILKTSDDEATLLALKTNLIRHNLNPVEEANALEELVNVKKDMKDMIRALNKSRTWISNRIKLAENATDGLKNAVLKEELPLISAIRIAELSEGLQGPVASKAIRERLNIGEVEKLVELFRKATNDNEIEFLLQTPVKDYMRSAPYINKKSAFRFRKGEPTLMKCDCGSLYIIDWTNCRVVNEKVVNHEHNHCFENNPKIFK
jgi:ParB family chromosome partitioning protein